MREQVIESVRAAIMAHVVPAEVLGEISYVDDEWRVLIAVTPSGPLLLMGFKLSVDFDKVLAVK